MVRTINACPSITFYLVACLILLEEGTWTQPDVGASSLPESIAILYRDKSDIEIIKDVFGDDLQGTAPITNNDPSALKVFLLTQSVRSCYIVVEARKMKEELQKKSHSTPYRELLKAARCSVGKNVSPVSRTSVSLVPSGGVLGMVPLHCIHPASFHLYPIFSSYIACIRKT